VVNTFLPLLAGSNLVAREDGWATQIAECEVVFITPSAMVMIDDHVVSNWKGGFSDL
jgi:hypothetical protein